MGTANATSARRNLYRLTGDANDSHEPVTITGKSTSSVLASEEDWKAIQETLYLSAVPGMRESSRKGMREPIERCSESERVIKVIRMWPRYEGSRCQSQLPRVVCLSVAPPTALTHDSAARNPTAMDPETGMAR